MGCVLLCDVRVGKRIGEIYPKHLSGKRHKMLTEGLAINTVDPNYFLVSGDNCVQLFEMRNLGSRPITEYLSPYHEINFTLCSNIKFLLDGSRFVASYQNYFPTLYSTNSDKPTHTFYEAGYIRAYSINSTIIRAINAC